MENKSIAPDGSIVGPSRLEELNKLGICYTCQMKHDPFCCEKISLCRNCRCAREWHPLDGPCRVGPETEFTLHNCYCPGYVPLDNIEYLETIYNKKLK